MDINNTVLGQGENRIQSSGLVKNKGVLLVLSDNQFGKTFIIDKNTATIGRDAGTDFHLTDSQVSAQHACISVNAENSFFIEDLGSTNSTFVNKKKIKKRKELLYGDRIVIGSTILRFFLEEKID